MTFPLISIHASRMGCDPSQSRLWFSLSNFNPRIPYGMRHVAWRDARLLVMISIHASRMGCDDIAVRVKDRIVISIHASRMGCDPSVFTSQSFQKYFNPRIPYGMRLLRPCTRRQASEFQSTHPVWDATLMAFQRSYPIAYFNPRIPYGMRPSSYCACPSFSNFNPRIPYGMRPL